MQITITLDTESLSETDKQILSSLSGAAAVVGDQASAPSAKSAPTTKAEPKATKKAEPKAVQKAEPEDDDDDSDGDDGATLQDAIDLATKVVSEGKAKAVKAALTSAGVKRVSELKASQVAAFMAELSD